MSETPLDQILNDEPTEEIIEDAPEETPERPRDEHGRFKAKEEETGEEPAPEAEPESVTPTQEEQRVPIAALKDERQKRQQLEQRLAEYEAYLQSLQAPQPQPQAAAEVPDMFAEPEAFQAFVVKQAVQQAIQALQPEIQHTRTLSRAEMTEIAARQKFEDYDATVEVFKEELARNPFLLTQLQQAADPATYAYNVGKQVQQARAYGADAPPSRDEMKAQLREELIAELGLNRPTAPSTIAGERSVGARTGPAWTGPTPLGQILGS